jgi:hypothetical protein
MKTCEFQIDNHYNCCGKRAIASFEYGRGGPVIYVCNDHDKFMLTHISVCLTEPLEEDYDRGNCPVYLKRIPV